MRAGNWVLELASLQVVWSEPERAKEPGSLSELVVEEWAWQDFAFEELLAVGEGQE